MDNNISKTGSAEGKTGKAPIYECHGHIMMEGNPRASLEALASAGVSYFRDGGDSKGLSVKMKPEAKALGIEYVTPVFAIHRAGRYGKIVGRAFEDQRDFISLVREAKSLGADFIKVMFSGIITFRQFGQLSCPSLEQKEISEMVNIAHGEGLAVMAHTNGAEAVLSAALAKTDSIEHGAFIVPENSEASAKEAQFSEARVSEALLAMKENGCFWVPTITAIGAFCGRDGFDANVCERTLKNHLRAVKAGLELGVKVCSGSDAGAFGTPCGSSSLTELGYLRDLGADEALLLKNNEELRARFRPGAPQV